MHIKVGDGQTNGKRVRVFVNGEDVTRLCREANTDECYVVLLKQREGRIVVPPEEIRVDGAVLVDIRSKE